MHSLLTKLWINFGSLLFALYLLFSTGKTTWENHLKFLIAAHHFRKDLAISQP